MTRLNVLTRRARISAIKSKSGGRRTVTQPEGAPDMAALLAKAQQMQQQLMEAQEQIAAAEVHGQAGGGLVQVTVKGSGEVVAVAIDPKVVDPEDIETLQDLIVGALADAAKQVTILAQSRLGPLAGGLGALSNPGF
jgi:nucleoid-associated protein EbfC